MRVTSALDLRMVLNRVVEAAVNLAKAEEGTLSAGRSAYRANCICMRRQAARDSRVTNCACRYRTASPGR